MLFSYDACQHWLDNLVNELQQGTHQTCNAYKPAILAYEKDCITVSKPVCRLQSMAAEQSMLDSVIAKGQQDSLTSRSTSDFLQREISSLRGQLQVGGLSYSASPRVRPYSTSLQAALNVTLWCNSCTFQAERLCGV